MSEKAILFDTARCTACKGCQVSCKCWNNLPSALDGSNEWSGSHQNPIDLNGSTRLIVTFDEQEGGPKGVEWAFGRRACQHCTDAPCAEVCPAGAIFKTEYGMVTVDESKCVGCRYCSMACPFDVPRYYEAPDAPWVFKRSIIDKCTGCVDRIAQGMAPACVTACQPEALQFGDREDMIKLAHESVDRLHERGFNDAVVYGEEEMGGLHVIQVLKYGVERHGQVADPKKNPLIDVMDIAKPVTGVIAGCVVVGLGVMRGLCSGYDRDERIYNPETGDTISLDTGEVLKHGDGQDPMSFKEHMSEALSGAKRDLLHKGADSENGKGGSNE